MTRPQMIRADTIDLQSEEAPSAKKHTTPSSKAAPNGSLAPHQAETLREVEEERAGEEGRSPRASWVDGDRPSDLQQYAEDLANGIANSLNGNKMQTEDALAIAQNGGVAGNAADDGDMDADADDMDDDMMDKISSSPSIEDGGYTFHSPVWPRRVDSLHHVARHRGSPNSLASNQARYPPRIESAQHTFQHPLSRQASKASADNADRHHPLPDDNGHNMDERDIEQHDISVPEWKTEDFSYDLESTIEVTESELDDEDGAQISPYEFLFPYDSFEEGDDDDDYSTMTINPDFLDIGWGSEYLQDIEDIDFEFVYALHTFVATVEGQANATKGDTMVLLDDSNSYWWLVRVVKDSSIGYLPAEHIETPTERLARLNKHRNIDLSATMLGDQAEKAKNPIKTAMRRRKKNVTFTAPTYVDYSDIDYSTEEEDGDSEKLALQQNSQQTQQQQEQQTASQQVVDEIMDDDESAKVEPLKPRAPQKQVKVETAKAEEKENGDSTAKSELRRDSNDMFDAKSERVTRNGTVRNTDSFFKDETIETKKITLTPGLLRDDNEPRISSESRDSSVRQRPSLEKDLAPDKNKDDKKKKDKDKKEKEKKPSAIRSFFSRKDRKKSIDDDDDSFGKRSMDASADVTEKDVEETQGADADVSPEKAPQRNPSKLQKHPRTDPSPTRKPSSAPQTGTERGPIFASEARANNVSNVPPATLRMVESEQLENQDRSQKKDKSSSKSVVTKEPKPQKVVKAKSRVELDDFDSPEEEEEVIPEPSRAAPEPPRQAPEGKQARPTLPGAYPDSYISTQTSASELSDQTVKPSQPGTKERLSESPVQVSPVISSSNPPALMVDTSSQEDRSSPVSSPSPELVDVDDRTHGKQDSMTTSTSATTTSTWNDANLRAFFDSGSDIRDLLVIVYDKNDVPPAGPDHPVVGTLFREQNARLAEITTQLDNMLGDWLARKQRLRGTV
ncbi:uncharacterized protein F4822DRAFT_433211 [Hypoxylon trugodes]|uniref:uncharacterized protein n=1 Tax=Hypoxylon trugodes TaxID=326681 RepID=UPI00219D50F1|nr:uncharacterized protein F4822DRAFT_433211 [Hypoxylon trugodes]KAI1384668.1 hypothetical protein F4822DRAFT_433211 [Hypoxylon trugodes]